MTTQQQVCRPDYRTGECPRAVVDAVGKLILEKLLFATCIGPVRLLALNIPSVCAAREWATRRVLCKPTYTVTNELYMREDPELRLVGDH